MAAVFGLSCQFTKHHISLFLQKETTRWQDKCDETAAIFSFIAQMSIVNSIYSIWLCEPDY